MAFDHRITVRLFEVDRAGIVFFARFFEYCQATFEELLTAVLGPLSRGPMFESCILPLVHTEAHFHRPAYLGEQLSIGVHVEHFSTRSLKLGYTIQDNEGVCRATVQMVHVCLHPQTFQSHPFPEALRQGLLRLGLLPSSPRVG